MNDHQYPNDNGMPEYPREPMNDTRPPAGLESPFRPAPAQMPAPTPAVPQEEKQPVKEAAAEAAPVAAEPMEAVPTELDSQEAPAQENGGEAAPTAAEAPQPERRQPAYYQPYRGQSYGMPGPGYRPTVPPYQPVPPYGATASYSPVPPSRPYYQAPPVTPPPARPAQPPVPPTGDQTPPEKDLWKDHKKKKRKKKGSGWLLALLIVSCLLLGIGAGVLIADVLDDDEEKDARPIQKPTVSESAGDAPSQETDRPSEAAPTESRPIPPMETEPLATTNGEQLTLNQIYTQNVPAIVGISNQATYNIFGQTSTTASTGTGFIISSDGQILTNYHVVEGAETLTVTLHDGSDYPATLVGYEAESDVALLKIEATDLPVCAIGNSDELYVGAQVAAIGNPLGELTYTMTVGYVSAMDRFVNTDGTPINMMQVDAAINPGNSGGPVFNIYGEVIGIATAKYSGTTNDGATIEGLGFAIPINDVLDILPDLRTNGAVLDRAYMGVMVSMLSLDKETYGIDYGVYVQSVEENGSAFKAGIQAEDIIVKIGDTAIESYENMTKALRGYRAGDSTTITVYRDGKEQTLEITFDARPETTEPVEVPTETEPATEDPWGGYPYPWGWPFG